MTSGESRDRGAARLAPADAEVIASISGLRAIDVMTTGIIGVAGYWSVEQLTRFLADKGISGAPVVDDQGAIVGVVSLTDVARRVVTAPASPATGKATRGSAFYEESEATSDAEEGRERVRALGAAVQPSLPPTTTVADIMTPMVFDVDIHAAVQEVAAQMVTGRIHRVFVTEKGRLVGVISALDLLKLVRDLPLP